jgi:hypothetical protein
LTYILKTFNLGYNFWIVSTRALIFHMSIPCHKTFPSVQKFDLVVLTLVLNLHFKNFNLGYNFWIVKNRALIFHLSIPCDKTFPWVHIFFTPWLWPLCLTYILKTLTMPRSFE